MAANIWPADAVSGSPNYTGNMARTTMGAALSKNTARPVGARSGINPSTPDSTFTATSTTWTVTPFGGVLDVEASAVEGPYWFAFTTNQTGSVNAANATNPRIDLLSVQMSDPASGDGTSTPLVAIVYTAGTAAASPVAPSTPARALAVAQITVPQSGGGSPSVAVVSPYLAGAGGVLRCRTSAEYPASPYKGQTVDDASLGLLRWDGTKWAVATPDRRAQFTQTVFSGITAATYTTLKNPTTDVDTIGLTYSAGLYTFPAGSTGTYEVSGQVSIVPAASTYLGASVEKNGTAQWQLLQPTNTSAFVHTVAVAPHEVSITAGDTISLSAFHTAATNTYVATGKYNSYLRIKLIG